jgi:hypothetical protein
MATVAESGVVFYLDVGAITAIAEFTMSPAKTAKKMLASFDIGSLAPSRRRVTLPLIPEHKGLDSPGLWRRSATETLNTCKTWGRRSAWSVGKRSR